MNNLHITLTDFGNESRVLKQVESISTLSNIQNIYIAALHSGGLEERETISKIIALKRFVLRSRNLGKGLLLQAVKYLEFCFRVISHYKGTGIGVVNVHSLNLLPLGCALKFFYGAKLVYDAHELETETNGLRGLRKKLSKLIEWLLIKKVDHIFVVSENIADWYESKYVISRPTVIMNAPKPQKVISNQYFREKFNLRDDQIIFLYQGVLAVGRGIDLLLNVFSKRANDHVVIVFMGYGALEERVRDKSYEFDTVFFHEAVPPTKLLNYTISADIGVSLIENTCLSYDYCMPNKLFEYAMVGLPVLVSNMKEMKEFVEKYHMGWVVENGSTDLISQAIDCITKIDMCEYKNNARSAALKNSWVYQEKKMLNDYKSLLGDL